MPKKELVDYFKKGLAKGFTKQRLKKELLNNGYPEKHVVEAMNSIPNKNSGKKPMKKMTADKVMQKAVQKNVNNSIAAGGSGKIKVGEQQLVGKQEGKSKKWMIWAIIGLVILILIVAGLWFFL
jgi:preprotein translocase subunit SecF